MIIVDHWKAASAKSSFKREYNNSFDLLGNMGVWAFFINPARTFV
ncbi:hypothetical protein J968_0083 [Acinetobacter baumannii 26016_2]|nr:hypothetical protein J968_0083 [Acinetobacter baumannii 26016_2]